MLCFVWVPEIRKQVTLKQPNTAAVEKQRSLSFLANTMRMRLGVPVFYMTSSGVNPDASQLHCIWHMLVDTFCCWNHSLHQLRIQEAIRLQLERADYMEGFLLTQSNEDQQINVKPRETKRWGMSQRLVFDGFFSFVRLCLFCFVGVFCEHLASCMYSSVRVYGCLDF